MKQHSASRFFFKRLLRDERGAILLMTTVYLPVIVGFFTLAVDYSYVLRTRNFLQATAEAAALAATAQLPDPTTSCTAAKNYAHVNMSIATYGDVLGSCNDVVLGAWDQNCTGIGCWHPLPVGSDCVTFHCNAAQVTTRMTTAAGNALSLVFAQMIGKSSFDVTATAIAVFGNNSGAWDVSIVQDISGSFTNSLPTARTAESSLLGCINTSAPAGSQVGITIFGETPFLYQSPLAVNTNLASLQTKITNLPQCVNNPPPGNTTPKCNGTDIAAGINTATASYPGSVTAGSQRAMVIITDGLPNMCAGVSCNQSTAQQNAQNAADAAAAAGNSVFTIYYCSSGNCDSNAQSWLATLVRNGGFALVTPDPTKLSTLMGQICASQPHRLVW